MIQFKEGDGGPEGGEVLVDELVTVIDEVLVDDDDDEDEDVSDLVLQLSPEGHKIDDVTEGIAL